MIQANERADPSQTRVEPLPDDPAGLGDRPTQDEVLAVIAHELRNPLAAIRNALHVYYQKCDDATLEWFLLVLEHQTQHMGHIIDELLEFSRMVSRKDKLQIKLVDIAKVVNLAVETVQPTFDELEQVLAVTLPQKPVLIEVDPNRLWQVLTNLLMNAAKYTERGGQILLTAEPDGANIVIRVEDMGIGIAADALPHIFKLRWQSSRAAGHAGGGLGIGLALVQKLVELHGGSVSAASAGPGKGSEFVVRLPISSTQPRITPTCPN